jgi:hypothetical protein
LNEVQLYFRISGAPREVEVGRGLTPVVIEIGHLEHLFWFAPSTRLKLVPLLNGYG